MGVELVGSGVGRERKKIKREEKTIKREEKKDQGQLGGWGGLIWLVGFGWVVAVGPSFAGPEGLWIVTLSE